MKGGSLAATAQLARAKQLAMSFEQRRNALRRAGSKGGSRSSLGSRGDVLGALLDNHKYGQLTSEVLDFLEPDVREVSLLPAGLKPLRAEMARRRDAVGAAVPALEALARALRTCHRSLRLPVLSELARSIGTLQLCSTSVLGCGHELSRSFRLAMHELYAALLAVLTTPSIGSAEARLVLQGLRLPYGRDDVAWIERSRLLEHIHGLASHAPDDARLTTYWVLSQVVHALGAPAAADAGEGSDAPVTAPLAGVVPNKVAARALATALEGTTGAE
jgi:hypothetical protein